MRPGWIDHFMSILTGIGRALLDHVKGQQDDFQLWTFQSNARARRFYEAGGFVAVEFTDGSGNEEQQPDVRYHWRRTTEDNPS